MHILHAITKIVLHQNDDEKEMKYEINAVNMM